MSNAATIKVEQNGRRHHCQVDTGETPKDLCQESTVRKWTLVHERKGLTC